MKKLYILKLAFAVLIALLVGVSSIAPVFASSQVITIQIDNSKSQTKFDIQGRTLKLWKISNEKINADLQTKLKEFEKYKTKELDETYKENFVTEKSDSKGLIGLKDLSDGTYYVREVTESGKVISPFFILMPMAETVIYPKIVIPQKPTPIPGKDTGKIKFRKISKTENNKGLEGAVFKVSIKEGSYYKDVMKDGKVYIVESGKEGYFEVTELDYGTYYLSEIKPPKGYRGLNEPIKFEINAESKDVLITINNDRQPSRTPNPNPNPNPEPKPNPNPNPNPQPNPHTKGYIPKTGDITLLILIVGGVLLFFMGYRMTKEL